MSVELSDSLMARALEHKYRARPSPDDEAVRRGREIWRIIMLDRAKRGYCFIDENCATLALYFNIPRLRVREIFDDEQRKHWARSEEQRWARNDVQHAAYSNPRAYE